MSMAPLPPELTDIPGPPRGHMWELLDRACECFERAADRADLARMQMEVCLADGSMTTEIDRVPVEKFLVLHFRATTVPA